MGVDNYIYSPKHKVGCHLGRFYNTVLSFSTNADQKTLGEQPYSQTDLHKYFEDNLLQIADWVNNDPDKDEEDYHSGLRYWNTVAMKFMQKYPDREYYFLPDTTNNFNYDHYNTVDVDEVLSYDDYWSKNHGPHRGVITQGRVIGILTCVDCGVEFKYEF